MCLDCGHMAMGKRKKRQGTMWVAASDLPKSPGHPFYQRLNAVLEQAGFDKVEYFNLTLGVVALHRGFKF